MTDHWRRRRIAELSLRFRHMEMPGGHGVLDVESPTPAPVAGPYETESMARTQCRMMLADAVEALYLPAEANFRAAVANIIREHSDPERAALFIWEFTSRSKA